MFILKNGREAAAGGEGGIFYRKAGWCAAGLHLATGMARSIAHSEIFPYGT
jgi:hypothetical protein